jgi:cysteinyl-tRNA synthetase
MGKKDKPAMIDTLLVEALIDARIEARAAGNFAEADRLRAEIVAQGVILMDAKDPATGQFSSTWRPIGAPHVDKAKDKTHDTPDDTP